MRTREEIRAQTRARVKARYWKRREELLYERRVRYHQNAELRKSIIESNKRSRRKPECKAREAQYIERRRGRAHEFARSKREARRLDGLRGLSLHELEHPTYKIRRDGHSITERWPPWDDAARWLAENDRQSPKAQVSRQGDTSAA